MSMASRLAKQQAGIEAWLGEPVLTCLPGLSGWGAVGSVAASTLSGGLGWMKNDRANEAGGGAAAITFAKNRYALIAITAAGDLKLLRTKMKRGRYEAEELVGSWERSRVGLTIEPAGTVYKFTLTADDLARPVELEVIRLGMGGLVADFATKAGVPFSEG